RDFTWEMLYAACKRDRLTVRTGHAAGPEGFGGAQPSPSATVVFPDARSVLTLARSRDIQEVKQYDLLTGQEQWARTLPSRAVLGRHHRPAAVFSPEKKELQRWELGGDPKPLTCALRDHPAQVTSHSFSPGQRILVTADTDRRLRVWDTGTGRLRHEL